MLNKTISITIFQLLQILLQLTIFLKKNNFVVSVINSVIQQRNKLQSDFYQLFNFRLTQKYKLLRLNMAQSENQFHISSYYNIYKVPLSLDQQKVLASLLPKNYSFQPYKCTRSIDQQSLRSEPIKANKKKLNKQQKDPDYAVNFTCAPKEPSVAKIESSQTIPGGEPFLECYLILKKLKKSVYSWPFKIPVDPKALGIPEYLNVILQPMDLKTIEDNLRKEAYKHPSQFHRDVYKILMNSYKFNQKNSQVFATTSEFQEEYLRIVKQAKEGKLVFVDKKGIKMENIFSDQLPILSKDRQSSAQNKPRTYIKRGKLQKMVDQQQKNEQMFQMYLGNQVEVEKEIEKEKEKGKGKGKERDQEKEKEKIKENEKEKDKEKVKIQQIFKEKQKGEKKQKKQKKIEKIEKVNKVDKIQKSDNIDKAEKNEKGIKLQIEKKERSQKNMKIQKIQKIQKVQRVKQQKQIVKVEVSPPFEIFEEYCQKQEQNVSFSDILDGNYFKQSRQAKQSKQQFSISNEPLKKTKQRQLTAENKIRRIKDKNEIQNLKQIRQLKEVTLVENQKNMAFNQIQKKLTDLLKKLNDFQIPKTKNKLPTKATEGFEHPNFNNFTSITASEKKKLSERISLLSCMDLKYVVEICFRNKRNKIRDDEGVYEIDLQKIDPKTLKQLSNFVAMRTKWVRKVAKSKDQISKMSPAEIVEEEIQNQPLFFQENNYIEEEENLPNIHEQHQNRLLQNDREIIIQQQDFHDHSYDRGFEYSPRQMIEVDVNNSDEQSYQPDDDDGNQFRF